MGGIMLSKTILRWGVVFVLGVVFLVLGLYSFIAKSSTYRFRHCNFGFVVAGLVLTPLASYPLRKAYRKAYGETTEKTSSSSSSSSSLSSSSSSSASEDKILSYAAAIGVQEVRRRDSLDWITNAPNTNKESVGLICNVPC